jgi:hypothetical protein
MFEELSKHNEGEDVAQMYDNSSWAIEKMREQGY